MRFFKTCAALVACATSMAIAAEPTPSASMNASTEVGEIVASQVQSAIASDASAVLDAFSGNIPPEVLDMVTQALNITVLQELSGVTNATQLDSLSEMVQQKLSEIGSTVHAGFTNDTFYGEDQDQDYDNLRQCLATVVRRAGRASAEKCLTRNGPDAIDNVKEIFRNMVDQYAFQLPMNTTIALQDEVDKYLANATLLPAAQELIENFQNATLSVAATVNGEYVEALYSAEACFFEALAQPIYTKAFEYQCNAGEVDKDNSTLANVGDIYRATVNQYAGVLPVEIVQNIQDIGTAHLSANISKADNQTRNDINAAVLSVVASTSGNTATLTYQLLDCLDLVLIPGAGNATTQEQCLKSPTGVAASRLNIINGYIQQFYGVLPPKLILNMKDNLTDTLGYNPSMDGADAIEAHLEELFKASAAGPEYVTCYQTFETCVVQAATNVTAADQCELGPECQERPFKLTEISPVSPYAAAVKAVQEGEQKGEPKSKQDTSAFAAAGKAAQENVKKVREANPKTRAPRKMAEPKKLQPVQASQGASNDHQPAAAAQAPQEAPAEQAPAEQPPAQEPPKKNAGKNGSLRAQDKPKSSYHKNKSMPHGNAQPALTENAVKKVASLFCMQG